MRRRCGLFVFACACASALLSTPAFAQELQPPPPMPPAQPMSPPAPMMSPPAPMNPSTPGMPGAAGAQPSYAEYETTRRLDEAEQEDSGRGFELFWLDGQIGGSYINMRQFSSETFQIEKADAGGPSFSAGAGVRFVVVVLGARLRHHALTSFNMWQINAEAGLKIPVKSFDILFGLHGGYSFVGRLGDASVATNTNTPAPTDAVSIRGFNGGADVAFDYYVSPVFSVGAGILADFLLLNRPPVDKPPSFDQLPQEQKDAINNDPLYQKSGTSAGLQLAGGLRLGLHFGL